MTLQPPESTLFPYTTLFRSIPGEKRFHQPGCPLVRKAGSKVQVMKQGEAERRSEEHTSELQSPCMLVCRLLLEKKKNSQMNQRLHASTIQTEYASDFRKRVE